MTEYGFLVIAVDEVCYVENYNDASNEKPPQKLSICHGGGKRNNGFKCACCKPSCNATEILTRLECENGGNIWTGGKECVVTTSDDTTCVASGTQITQTAYGDCKNGGSALAVGNILQTTVDCKCDTDHISVGDVCYKESVP